MKFSKVIQVGAGGIGQWFAPAAVKVLGSGHEDIHYEVYDGDEFEDRNIERQSFRLNGSSKAAVIVEHLNESAAPPQVQCFGIHRYLEDKDAFVLAIQAKLPSDLPVLVCMCVDNDMTRKLLYSAIEELRRRVVVIDMANELTTGDVIVSAWEKHEGRWGWVGASPFECYPQMVDPQDRTPGGYCQTEAPTHPQLVVANFFAASLGVQALWAMQSGDGNVNTQTMFDAAKPAVWGAV